MRVLPLKMKILAVCLRVGECAFAVVRGSARLLGRRHLWRWVDDGGVGHGAQARQRECPLQVVVSHVGGVAQGILIAQEVMDGVRIASRHAHELGRGLVPMHDLARLPGVGARGVA